LNIYLSCSSRNDFFIDAVIRVFEQKKTKFGSNAITLYYPPRAIPSDSGKVLTNVLKIREADLVIFDVTPDSTASAELALNSGVMIEYGIVVALENQQGIPWGRLPRPKYRIYLKDSISRSSVVTPILNQESIAPFSTTSDGTLQLEREISDLIEDKIKEILNFQVISTNAEVTVQIGQQILSIKSVYTS
jgi:hypothetical protein